MKTNLLEGLAVILISIICIYGALIVPPARSNEVWAGMIPFISSCLLLVLGLVLLKPTTRKPNHNKFKPPKLSDKGTKMTLVLFAVSFAYYLLIKIFGYIAPTALVTFIVFRLFGVRSVPALVIATILCPTIFYLLFFNVLGVFPPYAEVFDVINLIKE